MAKQLTIGIVAGEVSGDALGADFMHKMNALYPNIRWVGVGGTQMMQAGLHSIIDMNRLSVMGLVEVIKHLPDLFGAKKEILAQFARQKIDIFVGIDAPDFNLRIGKALQNQGIFRVQYVSPSVWAWRENRIHNIKMSCDLVLCLFPFELGVYQKHQHPAVCVGHHLLEKLHKDSRDLPHIRQEFISKHRDNFPTLAQIQDKLLCMMAGSRRSEITAILPILIQAMQQLDDGGTDFVLPVVSQEHAQLVQAMIDEQSPALLPKIHIIYGSADTLSISQQAMNASDAVVLASGTATLETLLLERPMVVVYKLNTLSYVLAKKLIKIPYVSLPNILSNEQIGEPIVPELIQQQANGGNIAWHIKTILDNPTKQTDKLASTCQKLRQDSHHNPAATVLQFFQQNMIGHHS